MPHSDPDRFRRRANFAFEQLRKADFSESIGISQRSEKSSPQDSKPPQRKRNEMGRLLEFYGGLQASPKNGVVPFLTEIFARNYAPPFEVSQVSAHQKPLTKAFIVTSERADN